MVLYICSYVFSHSLEHLIVDMYNKKIESLQQSVASAEKT